MYLDPPYQPISSILKYANYDKIGFGNDEQSELAEFLHYFNKKNIRFLASNASHPSIYELYEGLSITEIPARRSINSKSEGRVSIPELLISNF